MGFLFLIVFVRENITIPLSSRHYQSLIVTAATTGATKPVNMISIAAMVTFVTMKPVKIKAEDYSVLLQW